MSIAAGIITAPRPRATLNESIRSMRAGGFGMDVPVLVFQDGECPPITEPVDNVMVNSIPMGNLRNWHRALHILYYQTQAEWLMVCEDDIEWAKGAHEALLHDLNLFAVSLSFNKVGAVSLYCPIRMSGDMEKLYGGRLTRGWYGARKGMKTWGAQCLVFSRKQASMLLNDVGLQTFLNNKKWNKNVDAIVAECINSHSREIAYRIPCLVDHTYGDANSSLGYRDDRPNLKTAYFTGEA